VPQNYIIFNTAFQAGSRFW